MFMSQSPYLPFFNWLQAISQYLPRGDLRLRPAIYEMILHEFLKTDYEVFCILFNLFLSFRNPRVPDNFFFYLKKGFATLIREWPGELYNNMAIVQAVNDHLKRDPSNSTLLTTLAELWGNKILCLLHGK